MLERIIKPRWLREEMNLRMVDGGRVRLLDLTSGQCVVDGSVCEKGIRQERWKARGKGEAISWELLEGHDSVLEQIEFSWKVSVSV